MSSSRFFSLTTRILQHSVPTEHVVLAVVEAIALFIAYYIGVELRFIHGGTSEPLGPLYYKAILFSTVMLLSMIAFGAYLRTSQRSVNMMAIRIMGSMIAGIGFLGMTFYISPMLFLGRGALALATFVSLVFILAIRLVFRRIAESHDLRMRVLVLGAGNKAGLIRDAEKSGELGGINIVDYIAMPGDCGITAACNREAGLTEGRLMQAVDDKLIDVVVLAMDERREGLPVHELLDIKMSGIEVCDLITFFERSTSKIRLDILHPSWLFLSDGFKVSIFRRLVKRLFDIFCVLLLLPVVIPMGLLTTLAILVESRFRGPVLYSQTRVAENGKHFQIYKFRSMVVDAERDGVARWAQLKDSRITRVGSVLRKFRLDELPQLFNVLKGDMSFVGPRPERPEFVEKLAKEIPYYNERHRVKPGMTGWAQIRYQYGASEEDGREKLQYDLYYVKNYSMLLDLYILLATAEVVLLGKGAH